MEFEAIVNLDSVSIVDTQFQCKPHYVAMVLDL